MTEIENEVIQKACEVIRVFHFNVAKDNGGSEASKIVKDTKGGSIIHLLIADKKWDELFANQRWISFLEGAQKFVVMNSDLKIPLNIISKYFFKKTENILYPGILF